MKTLLLLVFTALTLNAGAQTISGKITDEKKETLRNLFESGFEEEVIADQLDLDLNTVRMLIKEL